jgi:hypothetical protein
LRSPVDVLTKQKAIARLLSVVDGCMPMPYNVLVVFLLSFHPLMTSISSVPLLNDAMEWFSWAAAM